MKINLKDPPRTYRCGAHKQIEIMDCGHIESAPDEQVTFVTESGAEYDLARKDWGFYATPSINGRLQSFGIRTALTRNALKQFFIMLVEQGHEDNFMTYLADDQIDFVAWLDDKTLPLIAAAIE